MLNYQIVTFGGSSTVSLFHGGQAYIANDSHPHWEKIIAALLAQDESVVDLFDLAATVQRKFLRLSENITVENGSVCLYGDPVHSTLTEKALEFLEAGVGDWKPLVAFYENTLLNPSESSREQMFDFLAHNRFQITDEGMIVGYKGVYKATGEESDNPDKGEYRSVHQGTTPVSVNDEPARPGYVYQSVGDTVSMARSLVDDNSGISCSSGLHISNYSYAQTYGDGVLEVVVHPRDVVSVPNEHEWQKVRACKYTIAGVAVEPTQGPLRESVPVEAVAPVALDADWYDNEDDDDEDDSWSWD